MGHCQGSDRACHPLRVQNCYKINLGLFSTQHCSHYFKVLLRYSVAAQANFKIQVLIFSSFNFPVSLEAVVILLIYSERCYSFALQCWEFNKCTWHIFSCGKTDDSQHLTLMLFEHLILLESDCVYLPVVLTLQNIFLVSAQLHRILIQWGVFCLFLFVCFFACFCFSFWLFFFFLNNICSFLPFTGTTFLSWGHFLF